MSSAPRVKIEVNHILMLIIVASPSTMMPVTMMNSLTILLLVLFLHESVAFTACSSRAAVNSHLFIAHSIIQTQVLAADAIVSCRQQQHISLHRNAVKSTRKRFKDLRSNIVALKSSKRDNESRRDVFKQSHCGAAADHQAMDRIVSKSDKDTLDGHLFRILHVCQFSLCRRLWWSNGRIIFTVIVSFVSGGGGGSSIHRSSPSRGLFFWFIIDANAWILSGYSCLRTLISSGSFILSLAKSFVSFQDLLMLIPRDDLALPMQLFSEELATYFIRPL